LGEGRFAEKSWSGERAGSARRAISPPGNVQFDRKSGRNLAKDARRNAVSRRKLLRNERLPESPDPVARRFRRARIIDHYVGQGSFALEGILRRLTRGEFRIAPAALFRAGQSQFPGCVDE
jgi:hypothetical protein